MSSEQVSRDLLQAFDNVLADGETMPLAELKKRYLASPDWARYNEHQIYRRVISLPLTIGMVLGDQADAVKKIVDGLKEIHGDELEFALDGRGEPELVVRTWRDQDALRKAWKDFAESEYKSTMLGGAA